MESQGLHFGNGIYDQLDKKCQNDHNLGVLKITLIYDLVEVVTDF